jgi:cell division protein FtsB
MNSKPKKFLPRSANLPGEHISENNNYPPSVPIYVYRQLVKDLNQAKVNLQSLKVQNEVLRAQNEELKAEVSQILNSAQNMGYILENKACILEQTRKSPLKSKPYQVVAKTEKGSSPFLFATESSWPEGSPLKSPFDKQILAVKYTDSHPRKNSLKKQEIRGLWLIVLITVLILSCFVGSFFVVKSVLKDHNSR